MRIVRCYLLALSLLLLVSCGFHLRGEEAIPSQLTSIYIQTNTPYSPFILQLKKTLQSGDVEIVDSPKNAAYILAIFKDQFNQYLVNVSANTIVRTYNLIYSVQFQLSDNNGKVIYGPDTVVTTLNYAQNQNQILSASNQYTLQQQNMIRDAIALMINRLSSERVRQALLNKNHQDAMTPRRQEKI